MGRTAHLCNVQEEGSTDRKPRKSRSPRAFRLRIIFTPSMTAIESSFVGLNGLQLVWESVAALLGALAIGLLAGSRLRGRGRRARAVSPEDASRARELDSLRRIAGELARTPDVEGVARALLDEIGSLFRVGFAALTFVSDDAREATGFLARSSRRDLDWWRDVHIDLTREPSGIAS